MPRSRLTLTKKLEFQRKFVEHDKSGDHKLDFEEMKDILVKGNPTLSDEDLRRLFDKVDKNNDGSVDFDEFVAYLYGEPSPVVTAPEAVKAKFLEFCGPEMDTMEFSKFCVDCQLLDKKFRKEDVGLTFAKVCPRGRRKITLAPGRDGVSQYDKLLCHVATKKGVTPEEVHDIVASGCKTNSGTVADSVRFHDDKRLYTGQHAHNENHDVRSGPAPKTERQKFDIGPDGDWGPVETTFKAFDRDGNGLDNREFVKMCEDCGLMDQDLARGELDVIFSLMKNKRIDFGMFRSCLYRVADKKRTNIILIQQQVASCEGPKLKATKADDVRLHDDKSTYTGTHAGK